jgi:parallel beta-helix repeat protein
MSMKRLLLCATLLLLVLSDAQATTYFVATNGSDTTGNGSSGSPWRWPKKCFSAGSPLVGGDICFIRAGTYQGPDASVWSGDTSVPSGSSAAAYTTIQGESRASVLLRPTAHGFHFDNDNWIAVKNLRIDGTLLPNTTPPNDQERLIAVNQGNGSLLENMELFGAAGCIHHPELGQQNVIVRNVLCHDVTRMGIYGRGITTGLYENNEVYNTGGVEILEGCNDPDCLSTFISSNVTFRNNYIHDTRYATGDVNGFGVGFTVGSGLLAYNNRITNSVDAGFYISNSPGAKIFNNTIYNNGADGIQCGIFSSGGGTCNVANNIITNNGGGEIVLYSGWTLTSTSTNNACTSAEASTCGLLPRVAFTGLTACTVSTLDLHLKPLPNPCANTGITLSDVPTDFEGDPRFTPYDIGADELGTSAPDTTPPGTVPNIRISQLGFYGHHA